jgi:hypothetical protein
MILFDIIAGTASIVSLVFAAYQYHKAKLFETVEKGNNNTLKERLKNIEVTLKTAATTNQLLIRRADENSVTKEELQNLARATRAQLFGAIVETDDMKSKLVEWNYGHLLKSITEQAPNNINIVEDTFNNEQTFEKEQ